MAVNNNFTTVINAGTSFYRITSLSYRTNAASKHKKVVDGQGGVNSRWGSRYCFAGSTAVYLTEDVVTCLAEKMFYFHREVLPSMDKYHINGVLPPFQQRFVLWEVKLAQPIVDVANLTIPNASAFNIYPSLMMNPSQDYHHLKDGRAHIQSLGYKGLRAPSARAVPGGNMVVLFDDQSKNLASIQAHEVDFRLICSGNPATPFANHATELLSFTQGDISFPTSTFPGMPSQAWHRVDFNH